MGPFSLQFHKILEKEKDLQGRLLCWYPSGEEQVKRRKVLPASHPDLSCRFCKESSMGKAELLADVDHVDVTARTATLNTIPGQPVI